MNKNKKEQAQPQSAKKGYVSLDAYKTKLKYIVKLQAAWRGYSARQQVAIVR